MSSERYEERYLEYFKTNDLTRTPVGAPNSVENPVPSQNHTEVNGEAAESDAMAKEREEQLEKWMSDIKSFIRKIDISRL